jgi:hypothetical protein
MSEMSFRDKFRRMNQRSLFGPDTTQPDGSVLPQDQPDKAAGGAQARAEALQRLQVGLFGIGTMVLLVGLASIIGNQADLADDAAVPEAAPTTEPSPAPSQANPLADAGVVPDIAVEPTATPSPEATGAIVPGNAAPAQ